MHTEVPSAFLANGRAILQPALEPRASSRAVTGTPTGISFDDCTGEVPPAHLLALLRERISLRQQAVRRAFEAGKAPLAGHVTAAHSRMMDELLSHLLDLAKARVSSHQEERRAPFAVLALGEYGSQALAPHAIPEIAVVLSPGRGAAAVPTIDHLQGMLWDLRVRVRVHAHTAAQWVARIADSERLRIAMLDGRMLWGEEDLAHDLLTGLMSAKPSVRARLAAVIWTARMRRHQRYGNGAGAAAPEVVQGRGGLRDLDSLRWLAQIQRGPGHGHLPARGHETIARAWWFLTTVRCHLHYITGEPHDRLDTRLQPEIALRMGYSGTPDDGTRQLMTDYRRVTAEVAGADALH
ncbi:MAG: hypothetical protein AAF637_08440 [Pseudomonadota bacterium]